MRWRAKGPVLLVRKETTPDDIHGMDVARGILTAIGGKSSHAAVVARGMGRPCIVGASGIRIDEVKKVFTAKADGKTLQSKKAISFRSTAPPAKFIWASQDRSSPTPATTTSASSWAGPTIPRQIRCPSQCGYPARRRKWRGSSGPKASACAGRNTCSSPRTACRLCRQMILATRRKSRSKALQKLLPMQR